MTEHVREKLVAANDIDAALEESLTTVWDAKVYSWDNSKYPFNEWMLNRIRGMGYKLDDLSYLHEAVPLNETYKVTKQLCADTNLPEFRRMLNRFVREVIVPQGKLRLMYEANPIGMVIEQAGGKAYAGPGRPILQITPGGIHERTPVILGSTLEVDHVLRHLQT